MTQHPCGRQPQLNDGDEDVWQGLPLFLEHVYLHLNVRVSVAVCAKSSGPFTFATQNDKSKSAHKRKHLQIHTHTHKDEEDEGEKKDIKRALVLSLSVVVAKFTSCRHTLGWDLLFSRNENLSFKSWKKKLSKSWDKKHKNWTISTNNNKISN